MIIVTLGDRNIGVLVDAASDILTLDECEMLPVPAMGAGHARSEVLILVTTRRRPTVDAVPGLQTETWLDEGPF